MARIQQASACGKNTGRGGGTQVVPCKGVRNDGSASWDGPLLRGRIRRSDSVRGTIADLLLCLGLLLVDRADDARALISASQCRAQARIGAWGGSSEDYSLCRGAASRVRRPGRSASGGELSPITSRRVPARASLCALRGGAPFTRLCAPEILHTASLRRNGPSTASD